MVTGANTGRNLTRTVIGVIIMALAITVVIQHRRIIALTREVNQFHALEELEKYKAEIKALESRIAEMQAKKDSTVTPLKKADTTAKAATKETPVENRVTNSSPFANRADFMNSPEMRENQRSFLSGRYDAFAEENNLSEETKTRLYDLLSEMRMEMMNRFPRPGRGGFSPDMMDNEDFMEQMKEINSTYEKKLSEILSVNELDAFKEYQNSEQERMLLMGFNVMAEDNSLDKEKENELIKALYNARQNDPETRREDNTLIIQGGPLGRGPMNEGVVNSSKLKAVYLETAKNILSEEQTQEFEDYLNARQSMPGMRRMPPPEMPQGME